MFYFISGSLAHLKPTFAVVNAAGVGFRLSISAKTYDALSPFAESEKNVKLFTHLSVREDDMELYGFATEAEMEMFKLLITVSGIGPKVALAVLSTFTPERFALAVCTEDKKAIASANGVGPKTAARMILELRDKMAANNSFSFHEGGVPATSVSQTPLPGGKLKEAQEALAVLGYGRAEILAALQKIDTSSINVEDIIKAALKLLI